MPPYGTARLEDGLCWPSIATPETPSTGTGVSTGVEGVSGGFLQVVGGAAEPGKVQEPMEFCNAKGHLWGQGRRGSGETTGSWGQRQGSWGCRATCHLHVEATRAVSITFKQPQGHM